jgi:hypothetical protein
MKHWLVYTISSLLLFSCGKKHDDGAVSMSLEQRDSLLITYITKEFYYDNPSTLREFKKQLKHFRTTSESDYTHEVDFKNYHFKSFLFDALSSAPPFVVEITNNNDQFVSLFSFTDQDYYSGNSIDKRPWISRSAKNDSILQQRIDLEKNLNQLVQKLNINKTKEIFDFTKKLCETLNMKPITQDSIQNEIKALCSNSDLAWGDSICNLVQAEQLAFFEKGEGEVLMVNTQSYLGFWRFWIEEVNGKPFIRAAFFSDILYTPMYM